MRPYRCFVAGGWGRLVGPALACALALAAAGCARNAGRDEAGPGEPGAVPSVGPAAMPAPAARLPVEDAILLAKERLSETSGQWRVESVQRAAGGWDLHFVSVGGPADFGGNCIARVTDDGRCHLSPG